MPESNLKFVNAMNVYIEIAQQCARSVREIAFDFEIEIAFELAFERESSAREPEKCSEGDCPIDNRENRADRSRSEKYRKRRPRF